ncbi:unnamed protein product [Rotaria sordida]|uniref:Uncharacterized protein n=1 Tax=Rotaria sordida TaxID=392033 RepID=A0A814JMF4_9BILA|nr:unnamed protein product [Rotaria sordida]CAF1006545.1 unnamed protein product [Rotaria sordida]CAF1039692.1 unnamed protein product [Rotaria sordida]
MQFHWIAPLALIPFVIGRKVIAFIIAALLVLVSIGSILSILLYNPTIPLNTIEEFSSTTRPSFFYDIYITPWCRISAYAVGLITDIPFFFDETCRDEV